MKPIHYIFICCFFSLSLGGFSQETAEDYVLSGLDKFKSPNRKGAIKDFTKAIALDSTNYEAYYYRSRAKSHRKEKDSSLHDLNKAKELCNKAIISNPKNSKAYRIRGWIKKHLGDKEGCCSDWKIAVDLGDLRIKKHYYLDCKKYLKDED